MEAHRKRLQRREDSGARFITFSTYRRLQLFSSNSIRDRFAVALANARDRYGFELFAWVLMPEHVHIALRATESPIAPILAGLKSGFAKSILTRWRETDAPLLERIADQHGRPRFWQRGGGYDRNIRDANDFREKVGYIHANPVRRGLVDRPTDWPWSSARWYAGDASGPVEIDRPHW